MENGTGSSSAGAPSGPTEGVIKFTVGERTVTGPLDLAEYGHIEEYRARLWERGMIGYDDAAGVGYGNISAGRASGGFVISGTQTGHKRALTGGDYVIVERWDFARNTVHCRGPCLPSSESLSHAALYERPEVGAVIHVHRRGLWEKLLREGTLATEEHIPYGSPELYRRISELVVGRPPREDTSGGGTATDGSREGGAQGYGSGTDDRGRMDGYPVGIPVILATRGHQDGVFAAGRTLAEAYAAIAERE